MKTQEIINKQLLFHKRGKAGCAFSSIASRKPQYYEWDHKVFQFFDSKSIDEAITNYINSKNVSTLSLIFPEVKTIYELCSLIHTLENCKTITSVRSKYENFQCFGLRIKVKDKLSWVTGFGPYSFFPETRKTPYTEITFRVKEKPNYEWEMKESAEETLHLAHMDMKNIEEQTFKKLWNYSLNNTEKQLGHKPDFISAAKTTFSIPAFI